MSRRMRPDETRLWSLVVEDVEPRPGQVRPAPPPDPAPPPSSTVAKTAAGAAPPPEKSLHRPHPATAPAAIEPNRARRIALGRETIARRLDLHGYGQDQAQDALVRFVSDAYAQGARAVLVITGKGMSGDGVLRRRTPEWLSQPPLRAMVAGISEARHRHGGKGAIYVALKRKG